MVKTKMKVASKKMVIDEMMKRIQMAGHKFTKKQCEIALKAFLETVQDLISKDMKVQLIPFGSWEVRERKARKGRNPKTKEEIMIPPRRVPVFRPGKMLKEVVK